MTGVLYHGLAAIVEVHIPEEVGTPLTQYLIPLARLGCMRGASAWSLAGLAIGVLVTFWSVLAKPGEERKGNVNRGGGLCLTLTVLFACWVLLVRPVNTAWGRYHLGRALLECGKRDQAERELLRCVQLAPDIQPAHRELGLMYAARGDTAAATLHLRTALELRGSDEVARRALHSLILAPNTKVPSQRR